MVRHDHAVQIYFLYGAYGWLLIGTMLHFGLNVVSQYIQGKRGPAAATTLYFVLNSAYAVRKSLFAVLALLQSGMVLRQWSGGPVCLSVLQAALPGWSSAFSSSSATIPPGDGIIRIASRGFGFYIMVVIRWAAFKLCPLRTSGSYLYEIK